MCLSISAKIWTIEELNKAYENPDRQDKLFCFGFFFFKSLVISSCIENNSNVSIDFTVGANMLPTFSHSESFCASFLP